MRTNFVLIDFENVQPQTFAALEADHYKVIVFVGATQAKMPFDVVNAIQRMGDRAQYVRISGNGPNALDFHIAFYIGQLAAQDPAAFFHIISKDTGFDPLIQHLKSKHIFAARSATIEAMPHPRANPKKAAQERAEVFGSVLRQPKSTKPRTEKSLGRHIATYFAKQQLTEEEIGAVVKALRDAGYARVVEGKVTYAHE